MTEIKFLCDGRARCSQEEKAECYINGGNCRHTNDIRHAKNFQSVHCARVTALTAEFCTEYVEKEPAAETTPQHEKLCFDIEAVTTNGTNVHEPISRRIKWPNT